MSSSDELKASRSSTTCVHPILDPTPHPLNPTHTPTHTQAQGNAAFSAGKFQDAIRLFSDAIALDPTNHILYSNRSASYASLLRYQEALDDADHVIQLKPDWAKGHGRKGAALSGLHRPQDAIAAYARGVELDPSSELLKQGLRDAEAAARGPGKVAGWGGAFSSPEFIARLATDPRTRAYMEQPDFLSMIRQVAADPRTMQNYIGDPRFQEAVSVGLELAHGEGDSAGSGGEGVNAVPAQPPSDTSAKDYTKEAMAAVEEIMRRSNVEEAKRKKEGAEVKPSQEAKHANGGDEAVGMDTEEDGAQAAGNKEKEAGNEAYKKKDFAAAIEHYNKALELYDRDISYLTNRAAVKFEQGDYEGCIGDCDAAVERGRELRADYKLVARAMTRKGNALAKQGKLEEAIEVYNRSLTEHRNADTLKRLQETEKTLKEKREEEYIDAEKCVEEKEKGNAAFKEQKYPEAVVHYTEALKRGPAKVNPEAYKLFSNRAACYTKLGAWNEGLKDAEECIALAPTFAKGYSRKGHLQFFMKEYDKAMETYEAGLKHDPENTELKEGLFRCLTAINRMSRGEASEDEVKERQAKAMADPEVQSILMDPVMRQVLGEMQEDPAAAQKHMSHPGIAKKIDKLVAAGVIQIR